MAIEADQAITLNYLFTCMGLFIQIGNIIYGIRHAIHRPTKFNLILLASATVYAISFVPLLLTSALTIELSTTPRTDANGYLFDRLDKLVRAYTGLFGAATLCYILLVQVRFRVVKTLMKYRDLYDWLFVFFTILVWFLTTFLFGVVLRVSATSQPLALGAWTIYALAVDNTLSFIFIRQLYKTRANVQPRRDQASRADWYKVVGSLLILCFISWVALILIVCGNVMFAHDQIMRTLLFRIGYSVSPVHFSGAMVFIYTVRSLVVNPTTATPPAPPATGYNERKSSLRGSTPSTTDLIDRKDLGYVMEYRYDLRHEPRTPLSSPVTPITPITPRPERSPILYPARTAAHFVPAMELERGIRVQDVERGRY
ncbi:hypothetical protein HDV00_011739 [Rhizophlyctis rosea]|nr:hypothetical protein HDV00_011739 [Rhizophlyctis rosea]